MKYLWVEDFNSGENRELEEKWRRHYRLKPEEIILKETFVEALAYLEENQNSFDAVLLDIDLEPGKPVDGKTYYDYLYDIVDQDFLDKNSDEIKRIAGFCIFLKLMIGLGFPKERIVFITANYDSRVICAQDLIDFFQRYSGEESIGSLRAELKGDERENDREKLNKYLKSFSNSEQDYLEDFSEIWENPQAKIKELLKFLKARRGEHKEYVNSLPGGNTYNLMEKTFKEAGIKPPQPFIKPDEELESDSADIQERYVEKFKEWKESVSTPYNQLRRGIIETCKILKEKIAREGKQFIHFNQVYINPKHRGQKEKQLDSEYFVNLLTYLENILPVREPASEKMRDNLYKQIIQTISHDWENSALAFYPQRRFYNKAFQYDEDFRKRYENFKGYVQKCTYSCVMKLLRNWTAHSKLVSFSAADVGFLYVIAMRCFFDLGDGFDGRYYPDDEEKNYNFHEKLLLSIDKKFLGDSELKKNLNHNYFIKTEKLLEASLIKINKLDPSFYNVSVDVMDKFRNIGDERSKRPCDASYLYKMFWHGLFFSEMDSGILRNKLTFTYEFNSDRDFLESIHKGDILFYLCKYSYYKAFSTDEILYERRNKKREEGFVNC